TAQAFDVKVVDRWSKGGLVKAIKNCDILVSGGGSLLQDVTSKNDIIYYLGIIKLAQILKKKVMIYAQGIGPVNHGRNRKLVRKILNKVDAITVRDLDSRMELMQMGVYREIMVCADPVMGILAEEIDAEAGKALLVQGGIDSNNAKPILMVAARSWQDNARLFAEVAAYCDHAVQAGWKVVLLPFHYPDDVAAGRQIVSQMKTTQLHAQNDVIVLEGNYTPQDTMALLKNADLILGMRLHSLIMGAGLLKPMIALSYDPKVESFMQLLRQKECFTVETVTAAQLDLAMEHLLHRSEKEVLMQKSFVEIMVRQAKEPAELLLKLFK
ncbi:MAG: polysaccharide pyruvyl transferase CsaB, partial [Alphaproteobacteria bacterium]|nr:polysaccharide pyruvyl transferase CsaB [Alphaproteobacteria bacterium]